MCAPSISRPRCLRQVMGHLELVVEEELDFSDLPLRLWERLLPRIAVHRQIIAFYKRLRIKLNEWKTKVRAATHGTARGSRAAAESFLRARGSSGSSAPRRRAPAWAWRCPSSTRRRGTSRARRSRRP